MANGEKGKGRSQNQRLKLFYLLDYLLEETDETHTKKVSEIITHFENYHKIPVEQKTVCSDLRLLGEYGYETQYDGRTRGWRLLDREFETQELQLLIDCVQSSRFITQRKAKELTDKLKKKASRHDRVYLDRRCYVPNRVRSQNDRIFYDLDDLHRAIANDSFVHIMKYGKRFIQRHMYPILTNTQLMTSEAWYLVYTKKIFQAV